MGSTASTETRTKAGAPAVTAVVARAWQAVRARRRTSVAVAVVLVAGVVCAVVFGTGSDSAAAGVQTTTRLVAASTGTIKESVSTTGTLAPAHTENVSFGSSAEVTSVKVAQGDKVAKGQVLGTIDDTALKATLAQARATLAQARSTLADAEDDSSTTDAQLDADEASVTSAKSAVADAKAAVAAATLRSPIAGVVAEVNVAVGDTASGSGSGDSSGSSDSSGGSASSTGSGSSTGGTSSAGSSSSSSSGDFVVVGTSAWTVSATVDDTQVGLIAKGDQAQITTDNVNGTIFGTVASVSVLSSSSSGSASYPVTIDVTGSPSGLHDGASATVSIIYKQVTNVLTVPSAAVHTDNGSSYVYVSKDGTKTKTTVKTGLSSGGTTQITSGLSSGEQVYVETVVRTGGGSTGSGTRTGTGNGGGTGSFPGGGGFPGGGSGNFPVGGGNAPAGAGGFGGGAR